MSHKKPKPSQRPASQKPLAKRTEARSVRAWASRVTLTPEWAAWRKQVFQRDGFRCVMCPHTPAAKLAFRALRRHLEPHHIIRKIERPDLVYEVDNGVTLCDACHKHVTGQEALFVVRFTAYVRRVNSRTQELAEALADETGWEEFGREFGRFA
jgi:5-methylcytosine-specific restriction endonuclease McrA